MYLVYLLGVPLLVMLLARRWTWIDKVSPMAVLYVIGLLVANLMNVCPDTGLNDTVGNLCIVVAIPLMLMSCNLRNWSAAGTLKAFFSGITAILIVTVAGYFLFRGGQDPQHFAQVCAVSVGIYTGGIPNMGAIARGVGMDQPTYLFITSYDLIVTGLYLVFVILFGRPVFRKLLPQPDRASHSSPKLGEVPAGRRSVSNSQFSILNFPFSTLLLPLAVTLVIAAVSYLASTLFPEDIATPMLILILTTLSVGASFLPFVRRATQENTTGGSPSFTMGLYFIYVFCFSIANACDVRQMDLGGSLTILAYISFVIFGSLLLQILFARLIKLDSDLTLTASVSLINSPPFVPMVAGLLGNKDVIVPGITIGLIGYMLGNYIGLGLFFLLS